MGEEGGDLLPKEGLTVPTCCNFQLDFAGIVDLRFGDQHFIIRLQLVIFFFDIDYRRK